MYLGPGDMETAVSTTSASHVTSEIHIRGVYFFEANDRKEKENYKIC
jgi:hypothetical protein